MSPEWGLGDINMCPARNAQVRFPPDQLSELGDLKQGNRI